MTNISKFPDRNIVKQEAVEWLIRLDSDAKPTTKELNDLREWLSRSPVHREELNSLNAFWSNNVLTELMVPLDQGLRRRRVLLAPIAFFSHYWRGISGLAVAAVCALMLLNVWFSPNAMTEANGIYLTAVGQQKSLTLPGGSLVVLNTNSQIEVAYSKQYRNIRLLQGEAYFEVAEDPEHPFRVYAGAGRVQAIGTAFNVHLREDGLNVFVTEGKVALASLGVSRALPEDYLIAGNQERSPVIDTYLNTESEELGTLEAGQSVTIDKELSSSDSIETARQELIDSVDTVDKRELDRRQSWRNGLLVFSGETLEQVVEEISRYTTVSIEIADSKVRQIQIGGRFKTGDIDNMFSALEANFGLEVNRLSYNRAQLTLAE